MVTGIIQTKFAPNLINGEGKPRQLIYVQAYLNLWIVWMHRYLKSNPSYVMNGFKEVVS